MADANLADLHTLYFARKGYVVTVKLSSTATEKLQEIFKREQNFHLFPKLPPELRAMIWKRAVYGQDRLVKLRIQMPHPRRLPVLTAYSAPLPPLFLVNKEAYFEARSSYVRLSPYIEIDSPPESFGPLLSFENDIFYYTDLHVVLHRDKWWVGTKQITEPPQSHSKLDHTGAFLNYD
ncbi:hypothetical protein F5Y12DRAFT_753739 [Xylaria sp. FL1777]|nr:hypothetical protein F5Y12DRAFT_753739 [Xylaria sp. FL1777]